MRYDLCLPWYWEYDNVFVGMVERACIEEGVSLWQIKPDNLLESVTALYKGVTTFKTLLNRGQGEPRFYSPLLGRFTQPDTLIPDPGNPQAWNRFSYVANRPLNYNDPTGHVACRSQEECDDMGTTPNGNGGLGNHDADNLDEELVESGSCGDSDLLIDTDGSDDGQGSTFFVLIPDGCSPANPKPTNDETANGQLFAMFGMYAEFCEIGCYFLGNPVIPIAAGLVDVVLTVASCVNFNECYVGQPHPGLPEMLVINQDVLVTGAEAVAPIIAAVAAGLLTEGVAALPAGAITDVVTSGGSLFHDIGRLNGDIPNMVSIGFDGEDAYILYYGVENE